MGGEDRKLEKQKEATSRRALDAMGLDFILEAMGNYLMSKQKTLLGLHFNQKNSAATMYQREEN